MKELNDVKAQIISFESILGTGKFVEVLIPKFQREYRWSKKQVLSFVEDAHSNFKQDAMSYFGGTTAYGERDFESKTLNVVDGQQRITTAYLLLCAGSRLLRLSGNAEYQKLLSRIDDCLFSKSSQGKKDYRLVSQHKEANSIIQDIADGRTVSCDNLTDPAANYAIAFGDLTNKIGELLPESSELAKFLEYFLVEAGVSMVMADAANATSMFVKQHSTMTPLDIVDQAKGMLFHASTVGDRSTLATEFHKVQSVLWGLAGPPERHFTQILRGLFPNEGRSASKLLTNISADTEKKKTTPLVWVTKTLLPAANALSRGLDGCHPDGTLCQPLKDIKDIPRLRRFRGIRPIIVAARTGSNAERTELMTALRNTLVVLAVAKNHPPDNEVFFANCAELLKEGEWQTAISAMKRHRDALSQDFSNAFHALRFDEFGSKGIRMLLNAAECAVLSEMGLTVFDSLYDLRKASDYHVEHVLPQESGSWSAWPGVKDPGDTYHRIGNLTILEGTRNVSAQDKDYSVKSSEYRLSDYNITKSIAVSIAGNGVANRAAKAAQLLEQFPMWDDDAISRRAAMLYGLVCRHLAVATASPAVVERAAAIDFSQARPDNTFLVLKAVALGSTTQSEIEEHLNQNDDKERNRQVAYCVKTLVFLDLVENLGDDEYALTEAGDNITSLPVTELEQAVRDRFKEVLSRTPEGEKLVNACTTSKGKSNAAVVEAVRAIYPDMAESMIEHRALSAVRWLMKPSKVSIKK